MKFPQSHMCAGSTLAAIAISMAAPWTTAIASSSGPNQIASSHELPMQLLSPGKRQAIEHALTLRLAEVARTCCQELDIPRATGVTAKFDLQHTAVVIELGPDLGPYSDAGAIEDLHSEMIEAVRSELEGKITVIGYDFLYGGKDMYYYFPDQRRGTMEIDTRESSSEKPVISISAGQRHRVCGDKSGRPLLRPSVRPMKALMSSLLATLLAFTSPVASSAPTHDAEEPTIDEVQHLIPPGADLVHMATNISHSKGRVEALLLIEMPSSGTDKRFVGTHRELLVIDRGNDGQLREADRNTRMFACPDCGETTDYPYTFIEVIESAFTVRLGDPSRDTWSDRFSFDYSTKAGTWILSKLARRSHDALTNRDALIELTPKNFGKVNFSDVDPAAFPVVQFDRRLPLP